MSLEKLLMICFQTIETKICQKKEITRNENS